MNSIKKILMVGLGNPGSHYARTRHNIGFMVADSLLRELALPSWEREKLAKLTRGSFGENDICIIKPRTYMNLSGKAVKHYMEKLKIPIGDLLVVLDDMALPFGKIRFRSRGSDGGHNGLASIIECVGTSDFSRLRVGIGSPPEYMEGADYVLSDFTGEEKKALDEILGRAVGGVKMFFENGIAESMNRFN